MRERQAFISPSANTRRNWFSRELRAVAAPIRSEYWHTLIRTCESAFKFTGCLATRIKKINNAQGYDAVRVKESNQFTHKYTQKKRKYVQRVEELQEVHWSASHAGSCYFNNRSWGNQCALRYAYAYVTNRERERESFYTVRQQQVWYAILNVVIVNAVY